MSRSRLSTATRSDGPSPRRVRQDVVPIMLDGAAALAAEMGYRQNIRQEATR